MKFNGRRRNQITKDQVMACFGYIRFAGPTMGNLLKRFGSETILYCLRCKERIRKKLTPRHICPCDLIAMLPIYEPKPSQAETPILQPGPTIASPRSNSNNSTRPSELKGSTSSLSQKNGNELENQPWFFNDDREKAEGRLKKAGNGTFLIRPSSRGGINNPYTLSLKFNGRVFNILVRKRTDGKFALGSEKVNEETFSSVVDIVKFYRTNELQLHGDGQPVGNTCLSQWPQPE